MEKLRPKEDAEILNGPLLVRSSSTVHRRSINKNDLISEDTNKSLMKGEFLNPSNTRKAIGRLYRRATSPNLNARTAKEEKQPEEKQEQKAPETQVRILKKVFSNSNWKSSSSTLQTPVSTNLVTVKEEITSMLAKQGTTEVRFNLEDMVNTDSLRAHLTLLKKFKSLEQPDSQTDVCYLLRAQERYKLWLNLLEQGKFSSPPLPPLDVCYIWHAHCLSPLRYFEDTQRLGFGRSINYNLPLRKLNELWDESSKHMHERSQQIWEQNTGKPWVLDPSDDSDFEFDCPWCAMPLHISAKNYMNLMRTQDHVETCFHCGALLSQDSISAKKFLDDVAEWMTSNKVEDLNTTTRQQYIRGTLVDIRTGEICYESTKTDCDLLFDVTSPHIVQLVAVQRLESKKCQWAIITNALKLRMEELKRQWKIENIRKGVVERIISSYAGITSTFSIDLVSAVLRQREFTHKMVTSDNNNDAAGWIERPEVLANIPIRYQKFLRLLRKPDLLLVPMLDIDLGWHTHMLHPKAYRKFTKTHLKRVINHDDTISQPVLEQGFSKTGKAWYKKYKEPYYPSNNFISNPSNDPTKKDWLKPSKKVMASIPNYGAFFFWKSKKNNKKEEREFKRRHSSYHITQPQPQAQLQKKYSFSRLTTIMSIQELQGKSDDEYETKNTTTSQNFLFNSTLYPQHDYGSCGSCGPGNCGMDAEDDDFNLINQYVVDL
ncbi:2103_t:CDS:2 [Ambispora leptoticha]|uniref:2103_t:CDS:1 n=1 Tax=Ambispora leptoticha TaxID=144679 RepID=A0A9N8WHB9_9GLOM|nr:2103_t:CDS:2 [Ambispora leptoticha]